MKQYTLIVIAWGDEVATTATVHEASGDELAVRDLADRLVRAVPQAIGYQVWSEGECLFSTFPAGRTACREASQTSSGRS